MKQLGIRTARHQCILAPTHCESMKKHIWILLAASWVAAGCAVTSPDEINEKYRDILEQRHDNYRLKAGDAIDIQFYGIEDQRLNQTGILVLPDGRSDLFFMKSTKVAGKTVPELREYVRAQVAAEVNPAGIKIQVTPAAEMIFMVGEFEKPGPIPLTVKMTIQEAISAAGGMKVTGDTDWALLRRPYSNPEEPDLFRVDLNDQTKDTFLLPGDQIVLQRTFLSSVALYIREYVFGFVPPGIWGLAYL